MTKCCGCPESAHTRYGAERVCDICGPQGCRGLRSANETCLRCGQPNAGHTSSDDCLKDLRARIEALEDCRGQPTP